MVITTLRRYPLTTLISLLLVLVSLSFINFDKYSPSLTVILYAMLKYLTSLVLLGAAGLSIINIALKKGIYINSEHVLHKLAKRFAPFLLLLCVFSYATVEGLGSYILHGSFDTVVKVVSIALVKFVSAFCMAFFALCIMAFRSRKEG